MGGAGLVYTEMTAVSEEGRITDRCAGLYKADHIEPWQKIVRFVHEHTTAKIAIQLGHAGPKGSTKAPWEGEDQPLAQGWPLIGPSAHAYAPTMPAPKEMTREDMDQV